MNIILKLRESGLQPEAATGFIFHDTAGETDRITCVKIGRILTRDHDQILKQFPYQDFDPKRDLLVIWNDPRIETHSHISLTGVVNFHAKVNDPTEVSLDGVGFELGVPEVTIELKRSTIMIGQNDSFMQTVCEMIVAHECSR